MKTKLVYVLTCDADKYYIEQALMSVYSARHYNPEAWIVLIVDDLTDKLLSGKRGQILKYISEKIVIPFSDITLSMMYRSRWIKTNIRSVVKGDFLFIDSDTIINKSLSEIDNCKYDIAAVWESHLPVAQFHPSMLEELRPRSQALGWNIDEESYYFSSGVIYVKDTELCYKFYEDWHNEWQAGNGKGVKIDQPSFAKANIMNGRVISKLDDVWNCISFTKPLFDKEAYILHFTAYRNVSYLFTERMYRKIIEHGIENPYIVKSVLNPTLTYYPYDNQLYRMKRNEYCGLIKALSKDVKLYSQNMDSKFSDFPCHGKFDRMVKNLFCNGLYRIGAVVMFLRSLYFVKISGKYRFTDNVCKSN